MKRLNLNSIAALGLAFLLLGPWDASAALLVQSKDESLGDLLWTKPRIYVTNTGTSPESLRRIRYYFTPTPGKTPQVNLWDPSGATAVIYTETSARSYVEVDLGSVILQPGEALRYGNGILFGLHNSDWSNWTKTDDWSAVAVSDQVVSNPRVVLIDSAQKTTNGTNGSTVLTDAPGCWESYGVLAKTMLNAGDRFKSQGSIQSGDTMLLGYNAYIENGAAYALGNMTLRDRAVVERDALAGGFQFLGADVHVGGVTAAGSNQIPACAVILPTGNLTIGSLDVILNPWTTRILAPGIYNNLDVGYGSTLVLSSGTYVFNSMQVRADGKLRLTSGRDPVKLDIAGNFQFGDRATMIFDGEVLPRRLHVTAYGTGTSIVSWDAVLQGTLSAPRANVLLRSRSKVIGGVVAGSVTAEPDAVVQWAPRVDPINLPPTLLLSTLMVPYGWSAAIHLTDIQVQDADTPLDQIVITVKSLPAIGIITKESSALAIGSTFTLFDLEMLRVEYQHTNAGATTDSFGIEVSDGVNKVAGTFRVQITSPILVGWNLQ